jgi:hypothetical protein
MPLTARAGDALLPFEAVHRWPFETTVAVVMAFVVVIGVALIGLVAAAPI